MSPPRHVCHMALFLTRKDVETYVHMLLREFVHAHQKKRRGLQLEDIFGGETLYEDIYLTVRVQFI